MQRFVLQFVKQHFLNEARFKAIFFRPCRYRDSVSF